MIDYRRDEGVCVKERYGRDGKMKCGKSRVIEIIMLGSGTCRKGQAEKGRSSNWE